MKKVLIASQMFYPDIAATAKAMTDLAEDIAKEEFEVTVLSQNRAYNNPNEVYRSSEKLKNVNINRFKVPNLSKNSIFGRLLLSYVVEKRAKKKFIEEKPDLSIAVSNPPNLAHRIAKLSKNKGIPFIFILHDLYPDILENLGMIKKGSIVSNRLRRITKETFEISSIIVVLGRDVKRLLMDNYNVDEKKIKVITNWGPSIKRSTKYSDFKEKHGLNNAFLITYSGNIGETAEFDTLIESAKKLENRNSIVFLFVGNGKRAKSIKQKAEKLKNVRFMDFLPEKDYMSLLNDSDAFFVSLKKNLCGNSVPSKVYYYMSSGKPIIGVLPNESEVSLLIREENIGFVCEDYSSDSLSEMIVDLFNNYNYSKLKERVKEVYEKKYKREIVTKKYIKLLKEFIQ